jgi:hypothetical protein
MSTRDQSLPIRHGFIAFEVPPMPAVIRYYDDFLDEHHTIRNPAGADVWRISVRGTERSLDFNLFAPELRMLMMGWCCYEFQTHAAPPCQYEVRHLPLTN